MKTSTAGVPFVLACAVVACSAAPTPSEPMPSATSPSGTPIAPSVAPSATATAPATALASSAALPLFPTSPFASAKVGDWWLFQRGAESGSVAIEWRIDKIDGDTITITSRSPWSNSYGGPPPPAATKSSKTAPSLELYDLHPGADATITDGTCELLGKMFPCKTIGYHTGDNTPCGGIARDQGKCHSNGASYEIKVSPAVKGGLLSYSVQAGLGSNGGSLLGFGAGLDLSLKDPYSAPGFTVEAGESAAQFVKHH